VPTLVYVHGRGLKPAPDVERKNWLVALNRGLQRLAPPVGQIADDEHFQLAYWSNIFYKPGDTEQNAGLSDIQAAAALGLAAKFWQWRLRETATAPADSTTKVFEDNFVRDVIKFFGLGFADTCAEPLKQRLLAVPSGDPVMLVSHSFGTVLAYQVLVGNLPDINAERADNGLAANSIDTGVTMGTPLSWVVDLQGLVPEWQEQLLVDVDQGLQPVLKTARGVLRTMGQLTQRVQLGNILSGVSFAPGVYQVPRKQFPPEGVARWFNIFDTRDPVACAGGFSSLLGGLDVGKTFLSGAAGDQRAFDVTIRNDACPAEVTLSDMRAHEDFFGYGQCAQLAQLVHDFWLRSGGQF
jgi:hypothetical protein